MESWATTIEQSKKLIELGIDKETADMRYEPYGDGILCIGKSIYFKDTTPAWSLSKLLELMPFPSLHNFFNNKWRCDIHYEDGGVRKFGEDADSPLDATFQMVCYLLENKMIK